nr:hypothetical protein [Ktedonobacteraceae bacterium]
MSTKGNPSHVSPATPPQGTRKGAFIIPRMRLPYYGREYGFASTFVHSRGTPCGYPAAGRVGGI